MHQHVPVVEQNPAALGDAFGVQHVDPFTPELGANRVRDRLQMSRRLAAADQEVVGDAGHALHVEHHQIPGALVQRGAGGATGLPLGGRRGHDSTDR